MNTLELEKTAIDATDLTKKERVVKMIMAIDDEMLLTEIEDYLSEILPISEEEEKEDWETLSIQTQARIEESIIQSETGQTLTFEEVKQNINRWLNKSSLPTTPMTT